MTKEIECDACSAPSGETKPDNVGTLVPHGWTLDFNPTRVLCPNCSADAVESGEIEVLVLRVPGTVH